MINYLKNAIRLIYNTKKELNVSFLRALWIRLDIHYCKRRKHMVQNEYDLFHFHRLNSLGRRSYIIGHELLTDTRGCNPRELWPVLDNKSLFNKTFMPFLGREFMVFSSDSSFSDFYSFVKHFPSVVIKPLSAFGGKGIQKVDIITEDTVRKLFEELSTGDWLIEETLEQADELSKLNHSSINTIRIITMIDREGKIHIPLANIRIGRAGNIVDNFSSGGITASIDVSSGVVVSKCYDRFGNAFSVHPDNGEQIIGFRIPEWEQILVTIQRAAAVVPSLRYVGWDVVVKKDHSISLIEGNRAAEARMMQVTQGRGLKEIYDKYLS